MNFFISPKELPKRRKRLFGNDAIPDMMVDDAGADFMLITNRGTVVIQRKTVSDLIASVADGRLASQLPLMRAVSEYPILLIENPFKYNRSGRLLIGKREQRWTKKGINNLLRTIKYVDLVDIEFSTSITDTVSIIYQLQEYFDTSKHLSTKHRPSFHSDWIVPTGMEKIIYFYQGIPGLGLMRAKVLSEHFPSPLDLFRASVKDISAVPGFGANTANRICGFLKGEI